MKVSSQYINIVICVYDFNYEPYIKLSRAKCNAITFHKEARKCFLTKQSECNIS